MIKRADRKNRFVAMFNSMISFYARSGVTDENGHDTGVDPFMTAFPELIDVGVTGHCVHEAGGLYFKSGVQRYRNGLKTKEPSMTLENSKRIADECEGKTFQPALGGRGDADQHENFAEISQYYRGNSIVPNFTPFGLDFTDEIIDLCRRYCSAIVISRYRQKYTYRAVQTFLDAGVKTNIHYTLGNNSIEEVIMRLKNNGLPAGTNTVIFLLHEPVGLGSEEDVLQMDNPLVRQFFRVVDTQKLNFKIGFDSCSIPAVLSLTRNVNHDSIDTCEGGRRSMYTTSDMKTLSCSFGDQELCWAFDISSVSIEEAWNSQQLRNFRSHFRNSYPDYQCQHAYMGDCSVHPQVVLCDKIGKELY